MKIRAVDRKMLKKLIRSHDLETMKSVAKEMGVSNTILSELIRGKYKPQLKETTREKICLFFDVSEDDLFPFVGANGEKSAS